MTKEGRKSVSNWTCVKVSIWAFCARIIIVPAFSPDFSWAVNLPCLAWTWNPGCSGEASVPINWPSLACKVTIASQLERLPFSSTSCPSTVAYERPSAGMRDSRVLIASLTGVPLTFTFTELRISSEPATLAESIFSPACKGTPYQVWVIILLASSNSDRPIELASTFLPLTKSSTLVLLGLWITTVAAGISMTELTVGERMVTRGESELGLAGVLVGAGAEVVWETVGFLGVRVVFWVVLSGASWMFAGSLLPSTFWLDAGWVEADWLVNGTFWLTSSPFWGVDALGSAIASGFTESGFTGSGFTGSGFTGSGFTGSTFATSLFPVSFWLDRTLTGLTKGSFCLIASGSLMSALTSEITSALTDGAIRSNITCGKAKIASLRRGAEVFFIILLRPVGDYY